MAYTVNSAFQEFNKDYVNLDPARSDTARNSRDWLYGQLNSLPDKDADFPFNYDDYHTKFGSFARKTKIRELDDIDLMYCLHGNAAYYSQGGNFNEYYIHTENAGPRLKNLSDNDILKSTRVVNRFVSSLKNIEHYKSAAIHRRQEAATLSLSSYEWVFDIVPSFYTTSGFYLIPDGSGNWKATDPRLDQDRTTRINQKHDGAILQLVRTLKYWNRRHSTFTIPSYCFEIMVLNYFDSRNSVADYIDFNIRDFLGHLVIAIYNPVYDPKGYEGNLNPFTFSDQIAVSAKANWAYEKAQAAIRAEIDERDSAKSMRIWQEIFGVDFPGYG
ncbi:MAG: hypothetical protein KA801_04385 [Syntrophorhabdaceae bacterium]|nr:hypothetical protein [Syntrophorhabdaceae bacterium]